MNPVNVVRADALGPALAALAKGRLCWAVTTPGASKRGWLAELKAACAPLGVTDGVSPNPRLDWVASESRRVAREADTIVALGGGSVLDAAKGLAAARGAADPAAFLDRHVRKSEPFPADFAPPRLIAIPTTAGTGSEVTMWGSLWDPETKHSISHPKLYPEHALIVPSLTYGLPYEQSLFPALDALSHSLEALWNRNATPASDGHALAAACALFRALSDDYARRYAEPAVRRAVQDASVEAGLAFSRTKTAIAHSISYPLTALLGVPHGLACSFTLPEALRLNGRHAPERGALIAKALGAASLEDAVSRLYALYAELGVGARLTGFVGSRAKAAGLGCSFIAPGRAENNLAPVDQAGAERLLDAALAGLGVK
jgi:phosphonate metabolism-associated iron-containing alcohol dehydrogenase